MKKILILVGAVLFSGLAFAQNYSTAQNQTTAAGSLLVTGNYGNQTSFSLPKYSVNIDGTKVTSGNSFQLVVPVTNQTNYPIRVIAYNPGTPEGISFGVSGSNTVDLGVGATQNFVYTFSAANPLPASVAGQTFNFSLQYSGQSLQTDSNTVTVQ